MFWNKKKTKRKSKPRPKHIRDILNAGEQVLKGLSGGIATTQKPTPYHVCAHMAEIAMGNVVEEVKEKGFISINDPCCYSRY